MLIEKVYENEDNIIGLCFKGNMEKALNAGLTASLFLHPGNKDIFSEMFTSYIAHKQLSLNAVRLRLKKELAERLVKIEKESAVSLNIIFFIEEAKKFCCLNRIDHAIRQIHTMGKDIGVGDPIDGVLNAVQEMKAITTQEIGESVRLDEGAIADFLSYYDEMSEKGGSKGISTGIDCLDEAINGGFKPGRLMCIAARPGVGKTSLSVNLSLSAALAGHRVQYFSIETLKNELIAKFVCTQSGLNTRVVDSFELDAKQSDDFMNGANALDKLPITIETNTRSSWEVVENLIRREHRLKGLKIAVVDYIQQFHIRNKKINSRAEELTEIADRAKAIALELEITVIMVAQLNRGAEENEDYKPKMSHLKDSGGLEQAADFIGFLHSANAEYKISLSVVKNRLGISGTMHLRVDLSTNKFHRE